MSEDNRKEVVSQPSVSYIYTYGYNYEDKIQKIQGKVLEQDTTLTNKPDMTKEGYTEFSRSLHSSLYKSFVISTYSSNLYFSG